MAIRFNERDRLIIPNWRPFNETTRLGELAACSKNNNNIPELSIDDYIAGFQKNPTIPFAADLLSAATVNGHNENRIVKEAAELILNQKQSVTNSQIEIANNIITNDSKTEKYDNKDAKIGLKNLQHFSISDIQKVKIQKLKKHIAYYPYNAIAWVELSRCYSILGQNKHSIKAMKVAIQLAPNNRYVSRCAVRLFSHYHELDFAHYILRKNPMTLHDPWLLSAELSISSLENKNSRFIKQGVQMINSKQYSPFSITELAGTIATIHLHAGDRKKSRKMFTESLISPNDNSVAQVEWVLNIKDKSLLPKESIIIHSQCDFEAKAITNFYNKNLIDALNNATSWFMDMPYSKRAVIFASHIADILDDKELSLNFLEKGLISHGEDSQILNNIAYYLALENKTEDASKYLQKINIETTSEFNSICLTATKGLIAFRNKEIERGRELYIDAIEKTSKLKNKELNWTAILNYAREELIANTDKIEYVMSFVSKIPNNEEHDVTIKKLYDEVLDLYNKHKENKL